VRFRHAKPYPTNPLERLNGRIKHITEVVGIFDKAAVVRFLGSILVEKSDEQAVQRA
jgi:transposase-like protein